MSKKIPKKMLFLNIFIIAETFFLKFFIYDLFPKKYFLDSSHIFEIMKGNMTSDKSYQYVANIFNNINIFQFDSLMQWGFFIALIFTPIFIGFLNKRNNYSTSEILFILASSFLLNVYVFCLSKDIIQFIFFGIIFIIIKNKKLSDNWKLFFIMAVLIYESLNFRIYYGIMAVMIFAFYIIYNLLIKKKEMNVKKISKIIFLIFIIFFFGIFMLQFISPKDYSSVVNARYNVNVMRTRDQAANTIILEPFGYNDTFPTFILNYSVNMLRMMIPIELVVKGVLPIAFIMYQLVITSNVLKASKKVNSENYFVIITVLSFIMISVIFEPDFGSFTRHESALIFFLIDIMGINKKGVKSNENKCYNSSV